MLNEYISHLEHPAEAQSSDTVVLSYFACEMGAAALLVSGCIYAGVKRGEDPSLSWQRTFVPSDFIIRDEHKHPSRP